MKVFEKIADRYGVAERNIFIGTSPEGKKAYYFLKDQSQDYIKVQDGTHRLCRANQAGNAVSYVFASYSPRNDEEVHNQTAYAIRQLKGKF